MQAANDNELPRTRAEAKAIGSTHYFTGKPCKHGHVAKRFTCDGGCIECSREFQRKKYDANPEKARARVRKLYAENPEPAKERERKRRKENPEGVKASETKWRLANPEKRNAIERKGQRRRYAANPDPFRKSNQKWRIGNPSALRKIRREYHKKLMEDPAYRLEKAISSGVRKGLVSGAKASRRTFSLLGYTSDDLRKHLEKQFQPGMTWDNYGRNGWHVDHKIPLAAHNYETPDDIDFKKAWALGNLQPLWEADNLKKSDKLLEPFQPSLALAA